MINPRMNREFIKKNNPKKDTPELLPTMLRNVQNWGNRRGSELLSEMQTFYNKVSSYVKFVALEKEGTAALTDDQTMALFGEFNPLTGKRELTDETVKAACERLWKPPSPAKKLLRDRDENIDPNIRAGKRPRKSVCINLKDKFEKMS
jgi:hypothetical protein